MATYSRALAIAPDHADAINNQGYLLQEQGRLEEAMALYRRALAANPHAARAAHSSQAAGGFRSDRPTRVAGISPAAMSW
mgnify:CR=1 FL=1